MVERTHTSEATLLKESECSNEGTRRKSRDCMNASRLNAAAAGEGEGAVRSFSFLPRLSRLALRLFCSKITSMLSI